MKKVLLSVLLGVMGCVGGAQAATATGNFDVSINLTSACKVTTLPTAEFTYTALQTTAATMTPSSVGITCTNLLPITSVTLDSTSITDQATDLAYTLTLGTAPTVGTGAAQTIALTGSMAANQSGKCATASCTNSASTNKQRTITITY